MEFSVVVPARNEVDLVPKTLPTYLALKPSELVLCLDKPAPKDLLDAIAKTTRKCNAEDVVNVLQVPRGGWGDQMMKVRRAGFMKTHENLILTGDIDLLVNSNVFKALRIVGKNGVGLASLTKLRLPHDLLGLYRFFGENMLRLVAHKFSKFGATSFTGLYAFWKDYWLESEPINLAKKYSQVKRKVRDGLKLEMKDFLLVGEDTHMRDCMAKKYRVTYLPDIGGVVLADPHEDEPLVQFSKGIYFARKKGRSTAVALGRSFVRAQPHYLLGHLKGKQLLRRELHKN